MGSSLGVRALGFTLCVAGLLPAPGLADGGAPDPGVGSLSARVAATSGVDTNPARNFSQTGSQPDAVFSAVAEVRGAYLRDWLAASAELELAGRKFLFQGMEDTLAQRADLELSARLARVLRAGVVGMARARLGGEHPDADLAAGGYLAFAPDRRLEVRAQVGAQRFVYFPDPQFDFGATELGGKARLRIDGRQQLFAEGGLSLRTFGAQARPRPPQPVGSAPGRRADTALLALVGYAFRGPVVWSASYAFLGDDSNSFGESFARHRLSAQGAVRLPWELTLLGQLSVQFTHYPDGVYLSPELQLIEDTEAWNSVAAQLTRPVGGPFELSLAYLLTFGQLNTNGLSYARQLLTFGVSVRLDPGSGAR